MDEIKTKQQVVEKIKESAKILVTVSDNPSVDALSAALALTLLFDKQGKYATSIFSGETPPAIAFLEPEKTFDDTTDSLRDFIIALNKEKADHLRYKVEGDSVKIFITPYKTTINERDLEFSQGDYNVELVIALGVANQDHLDKALENHGQILHDATIITVTSGEQWSDLGGIDWHDANASSLSEMVTGLAEALKEDKKKPLIDTPIATALLTGIVAQTDRFSNEHTTSKAMTVAASLMSAGADQQLIANELQAANEIESKSNDSDDDDSSNKNEDTHNKKSSDDNDSSDEDRDPSTLAIKHDDETLAELDRRMRGEKEAREKVIEEVEAAQEAAAEEDEHDESNAPEAAESSDEKSNPIDEGSPFFVPVPLAELQQEPVQEPEETPAPQPEPTPVSTPEPTLAPIAEPTFEPTPPAPQISPASVEPDYEETPRPAAGTAYAPLDGVEEPTFAGTLNATTEQAADDARREIASDQNRTILSHAYLGSTEDPSKTSANSTEGFPGTPPIAPGSVGVNEVVAPVQTESMHSAYAPTTSSEPSVAIGGERVIQPLSQPAADPTDLGLPLPPPIPDFSQLGGAGPAFPLPPAPQAQPSILGDILAPEPTVDYTANAIPAPNTAYAPVDVPALPPLNTQPVSPEPASVLARPADPGQFQIPS